MKWKWKWPSKINPAKNRADESRSLDKTNESGSDESYTSHRDLDNSGNSTFEVNLETELKQYGVKCDDDSLSIGKSGEIIIGEGAENMSDLTEFPQKNIVDAVSLDDSASGEKIEKDRLTFADQEKTDTSDALVVIDNAGDSSDLNSEGKKEIVVEVPRKSLYAERLNLELQSLMVEKETCDGQVHEVLQYLQSPHGIYDSIKSYSTGIPGDFIDNKEKQIDIIGKSPSFIIFDFENNTYYDNEFHLMKECYVGEGENLHVCKDNGIYIDSKIFTSSSVFLTKKEEVKSDSNFLRALEEIIDNSLKGFEYKSKFSLFCMLPEAVDVFNTSIRRCLNTSKGKIISIPKSIAATYYVLEELSIGDRFCVVDLDGLHPVVTQLFIGQDDNGNKVIFREGFIRKHAIRFNYVEFAKEYIKKYQDKYKVGFTKNELDRLIYAKELSRVFTRNERIKLFRSEGRIDVIFDEAIYNACLKKYITRDYEIANCGHVYLVSSIDGLITGQKIVEINNRNCCEGLLAIRTKLLEEPEAIIWKERLPKVSLEVIDDAYGRFNSIDLIDENNEGQDIRLSLDEEVELPFKGTITLQKGKKEYYLPLEREIFSEDVNSAKEAYFYDKAFPLDEDVPVELVVKYNYLSESPIKIYARPKIKIDGFPELVNTWVDPHEIKAYSGTVYEGHSKGMIKPKEDVFERTHAGLDQFLNGFADLSSSSFVYEPRGQYEYHKDFRTLNGSYFQIRSTFDPYNISDVDFMYMYQEGRLSDIFALANQVLTCNAAFYGDSYRHVVRRYKLSIENLFSNLVVATWYYDKSDDNIQQVYSYCVKENEIRLLAKLSRCIQCAKDDLFGVFDKLSTEIKDYFDNQYKDDRFGDQRLSYIRALSQNCWFTTSWLNQFYHTSNGPEAIYLIVETIWDYLYDRTFRTDKEYRDIMEFLVCLTMARNYDDSMFNPNDKNTRNFLQEIKISYEYALNQIPLESLKSRLEMEQDQGALYGYHNYIYMLIVILSGEGQINLVGYHDD